jgi:hypothetical protein
MDWFEVGFGAIQAVYTRIMYFERLDTSCYAGAWAVGDTIIQLSQFLPWENSTERYIFFYL